MEKLLEILKEIRPDVDFENETELVDAGVLDSLDIATIISELNDAFDIAIRVTELDPENFNSMKAIHEMVLKLQNQ